jgi:hypothetical protein
MRKRVALVTWREERERARRLAAAHAEVLAAGGTAGARPRTAGGQVRQQRAGLHSALVGSVRTWNIMWVISGADENGDKQAACHVLVVRCRAQQEGLQAYACIVLLSACGQHLLQMMTCWGHPASVCQLEPCAGPAGLC